MGDIFTALSDLISGLLTGLGLDSAMAQLVVAFLGAFGIANFVLLGLILNIWFERKISGRIQDRIGPNRLGWWGLMQTFADLGKLLTKEIITPAGADVIPFMIAPIIATLSVIMIWAVLPWTSLTIGSDLGVGALYMVAVGSFGILAVLLAGWSSNNKYALLGAFRGVAMLVSYEVPMILTLMVPVLLAGTMQVGKIVEAQQVWYIFSMPLAALIFSIAMTAEVGRPPFDLLEAESEIVAGYHIEYGGFAFAMFYAAEWAHAFTMSAMIAVLFLGGWRGPGAETYPTLGLVYFLLKTYLMYFLNVWVRFTVPRLRIDQTMAFCWKFLIPLALLLLVVTVLVDKIAAGLIANYLSTESILAMLPRSIVLLGVNIVVSALAVWWMALMGRRERVRQETAVQRAPARGRAAH